MAQRKYEIVNHINFSDVKQGQFITLENDKNKYCVFKRGQEYILVKVILDDLKKINMYDIHQPIITNIFDGKTGSCIKHREVNDTMKGSDEE